jgi:hypothetical protein
MGLFATFDASCFKANDLEFLFVQRYPDDFEIFTTREVRRALAWAARLGAPPAAQPTTLRSGSSTKLESSA